MKKIIFGLILILHGSIQSMENDNSILQQDRLSFVTPPTTPPQQAGSPGRRSDAVMNLVVLIGLGDETQFNLYRFMRRRRRARAATNLTHLEPRRPLQPRRLHFGPVDQGDESDPEFLHNIHHD